MSTVVHTHGLLRLTDVMITNNTEAVVAVVVAYSCLSVAESPAPIQREAKMRAWTSTRCRESRFWGEDLKNSTQLCAGYESGYIATCYVSLRCHTVRGLPWSGVF